MLFIGAANVVASRPPEHRPTGTPHARVKMNLNFSSERTADLGIRNQQKFKLCDTHWFLPYSGVCSCRGVSHRCWKWLIIFLFWPSILTRRKNVKSVYFIILKIKIFINDKDLTILNQGTTLSIIEQTPNREIRPPNVSYRWGPVKSSSFDLNPKYSRFSKWHFLLISW